MIMQSLLPAHCKFLHALVASSITCWIASVAAAQSNNQPLPAFVPGNSSPVLVLGGVEPPRPTSSSWLVTTQRFELQPPPIEQRIEKATPVDRVAEQPTEAPKLQRPDPDRPAQPRIIERPRIVDKPRDGDKPRDAREGQRPGGPDMRGENRMDNRGPQSGPQDRRGPNGLPGWAPWPNFGGNQPSRGPGNNNMGNNNMGPGRSGPDALEEQLRLVERLFTSPIIKRHLELVEENAQLRAQVQMQEKLWQRERERAGDHQPGRDESRAERERDLRAQAEQAEREAHLRRAREEMEVQQMEKREMASQIEKLKARLKDVQAELEEQREKSSEKKKNKD